MRSEDRKLEAEKQRILKLIKRGRYQEFYKRYDTQEGTRIGDIFWRRSKLPLIIECTEANLRTGEQRWPHLMIVTEELYKSGMKLPDHNGIKNRLVHFADCEQVSIKIKHDPAITKALADARKKQRAQRRKRKEQG